ncbi:NAD(P)-dependent oxidoreductase [Lacticaseibacillus thailandensis]|uniref:NAD(P)-dependent oxidoreductase n=1 Tax=Lacticaseibacillus thailandensis TaxID=381741 RepID=UPI0012E2BB46|nr:NAD(P)-dependent oxidoreductase [Lacticaseibacillus thailandensis]
MGHQHTGGHARAVAEAALMDILLLARNIPQTQACMQQSGWAAAYGLLGHEVGSATVGIVGFGHIGQLLAQLLTGLGARVLIYDRHPRPTPYGSFVTWDELFRRSDYVSLHLAAVPDTIHSVSAHEFGLMPEHAGLINLARGSIVDEPALIAALQNGTIGGAALDVFAEEPLPADNPLWHLPNVLVTPHIGANTEEANRTMAMTAARMIDQVLSGQRPDFPVNEPQFK